MKKLLIIGIDPGTTLGYALLDIDGNPIRLSSSKNYTLNSVISEILEHGSPLIIGSDKKQAPALVASIATKLGARLIIHDHDLSVSEKKEICRGFEYKDDHERDALASALFAYKRQRKLFEKVDIYLKKLDLAEFSSRVKEICVKKKMNIFDAIDSVIQLPENKSEYKDNNVPLTPDQEKLALKGRIKGLMREIMLLREHNSSLRKSVEDMKSLPRINRIKKLPNQKVQRLLNSKENSIAYLQKRIDDMRNEANKAGYELSKLYSFIGKISGKVLLKKLDNLGWDELQDKNKIIDIKKDDILYVKDISICNNKTIEFLNTKGVLILLYEQGKADLDLILVNCKGLNIEHEKHFALVDRKELDQKKNSISLLKHIISSYRK